ncbi:MAG: helix-turn-helix domain-containing protein [Firmicutes bacterium]|nr:helix-turn-helix domain-containing protein [Bacillota bacterium]
MYDSKFKCETNDDLFKAILTLETEEDCYRFFEDLLTIKELQSMAQRWQVVRMLKEKMTYIDIAAETGASATTISRVNKCLHYGAGGYAAVLKKLDK